MGMDLASAHRGTQERALRENGGLFPLQRKYTFTPQGPSGISKQWPFRGSDSKPGTQAPYLVQTLASDVPLCLQWQLVPQDLLLLPRPADPPMLIPLSVPECPSHFCPGEVSGAVCICQKMFYVRTDLLLVLFLETTSQYSPDWP